MNREEKKKTIIFKLFLLDHSLMKKKKNNDSQTFLLNTLYQEMRNGVDTMNRESYKCC